MPRLPLFRPPAVKRGLFWLGDASWNGAVWVLRFDPAKAEIAPLKDFAPAAPPPAGEKK